MQMEARLQTLRATMAGEREKRDAQRARNPTASVWRSARTDAPVNSGAYADGVLKAKPPPGAAPARRRGSRDATAAGGLPAGGDAANRGAVQPLLSAAQAQESSKAAAQPFGKTKSALFEWNPAASFGAEREREQRQLAAPRHLRRG